MAATASIAGKFPKRPKLLPVKMVLFNTCFGRLSTPIPLLKRGFGISNKDSSISLAYQLPPIRATKSNFLVAMVAEDLMADKDQEYGGKKFYEHLLGTSNKGWRMGSCSSGASSSSNFIGKSAYIPLAIKIHINTYGKFGFYTCILTV